MKQVRYPFKSDAIKSAKVLAECTAELLFGQCKKYYAVMKGSGNMEKMRKYILISPNRDRVVEYMQDRCNSFARRDKPERIEIYIFGDKIDYERIKKGMYSWRYIPTYR